MALAALLFGWFHKPQAMLHFYEKTDLFFVRSMTGSFLILLTVTRKSANAPQFSLLSNFI